MSRVIPFPQRQHEEFSQLVLKAVEAEAVRLNIRIEDYIEDIYFQGVDPPLFREKKSLEKLYNKYMDLIDNSVTSVEDSTTMKASSKTYLCYRIYLHAMTLKRQVLSEIDAKKYLIDALREYFYSLGKVLKLHEEITLIKIIDSAVYDAEALDFD